MGSPKFKLQYFVALLLTLFKVRVSHAFQPIRTHSSNPSFGAHNFKRNHYLPQRAYRHEKFSKGNNNDENFPWSFNGRLWFRPSFVRTKTIENTIKETLPPSVSILSIFGWTIGGVVALEYDDSPVGPYREYVSMGAVVSKRGALGQWGSRLYVSTPEAEQVCQDIWNVPAELADIKFSELSDDNESSQLCVKSAPNAEIVDKSKSHSDVESISVSGWRNTRVVDSIEVKRSPQGGIPVLWTPSIKALWAPLIPQPFSFQNDPLPLHKLRLSASAIRLRFCGQPSSELLGIPLGIGLIVDNVLIEISDRKGSL